MDDDSSDDFEILQDWELVNEENSTENEDVPVDSIFNLVPAFDGANGIPNAVEPVEECFSVDENDDAETVLRKFHLAVGCRKLRDIEKSSRRRIETDDAQLPPDPDDRCESDISGGDDDTDLSSFSPGVLDVSLFAGARGTLRIYTHQPNQTLDNVLTCLAVVALFFAVGAGIGHYIGTAHEILLKHLQSERVKSLQQEYQMCFKNANELKAKLDEFSSIKAAVTHQSINYLLPSRDHNQHHPQADNSSPVLQQKQLIIDTPDIQNVSAGGYLLNNMHSYIDPEEIESPTLKNEINENTPNVLDGFPQGNGDKHIFDESHATHKKVELCVLEGKNSKIDDDDDREENIDVYSVNSKMLYNGKTIDLHNTLNHLRPRSIHRKIYYDLKSLYNGRISAESGLLQSKGHELHGYDDDIKMLYNGKKSNSHKKRKKCDGDDDGDYKRKRHNRSFLDPNQNHLIEKLNNWLNHFTEESFLSLDHEVIGNYFKVFSDLYKKLNHVKPKYYRGKRKTVQDSSSSITWSACQKKWWEKIMKKAWYDKDDVEDFYDDLNFKTCQVYYTSWQLSIAMNPFKLLFSGSDSSSRARKYLVKLMKKFHIRWPTFLNNISEEDRSDKGRHHHYHHSKSKKQRE